MIRVERTVKVLNIAKHEDKWEVKTVSADNPYIFFTFCDFAKRPRIKKKDINVGDIIYRGESLR